LYGFGGRGLENQELRSRLIYVLIILTVIGVAVISYLNIQYVYADHFQAGVEIGGIAVHGQNKESAAVAINELVDDVSKNKVIFFKDNYEYETTLGALITPINAGDIVNTVWEQELNRSKWDKYTNRHGQRIISYPVMLTYESSIKDELGGQWQKIWGRAPVDAGLDVDNQGGVIIIPAQTGSKVDAELTFNGLPSEVGSYLKVKVPIIVEEEEPEIKTATLNGMGLLATYSTYFNTGEINRSHNLYLAASSINRKLIPPGEIFSFNNTVGQRTLESGYLDAKVIVGNKFEPGLGGGICQVSSTLYNACLLSGLEIVERSNHGLAVTYVPLGRDATVAWGIQDYKFRNNTNEPLYIRTFTGSGKLTVNIYGNLQNRKRIEISNIIDQSLDYATIVERNSKLAPGQEIVDHNGQLGYVVRAFRTIYDNDGKVVNTEQLSRDTYKPLNKLVIKGPDPITVPPTETNQSSGSGNKPSNNGTHGNNKPNNGRPEVNVEPFDPNLVQP